MKQSLTVRFVIILAVVGFLGVMAFLGVGRDRLELGIDLKGGSELIFKFDFTEGTNRKELLTEAIAVIQDRIDGYGLKDIVIQPIGDESFAVQISAKDKEKVDAIKELITDLGLLEFRITVEPKATDNYAHYWTLYQEALKKGVQDAQARNIAPADVKKDEQARFPGGLRWYPLSGKAREPGGYGLDRLGRDENGEVRPWVLCERDQYDITGKALKNVYHARDQGGIGGGFAVYFQVEKFHQKEMAGLTAFEEDKYMGIILNDHVSSAPVLRSTLSDQGQITGAFGEKEARQLAAVLQAGALQQKPTLTSERTIAPDLAGNARDDGILSTLLGFCLVLVLMVWFYYGPGMLANLALLLNLIMLLGVLTWFEAVLTLPGIAGVILTVGMAVDANILVFERIKEEKAKGRTIAQAIATGYDRALVTIVDANLTTLITAYFLFQIGSGPVRGFGITLAVGIVASMFTALYVTRTVMELGLRRGWVTDAKMRGEWVTPSIRWMSLKRTAVILSAVAMVAGVALWEVVPEKARYDLDFTEGSKLIVSFHEEQDADAVRKTIRDAGYTDVAVRASAAGIGQEVGQRGGTGFELRSQSIASQQQIDTLKTKLREVFRGKILPGPFQGTLVPGAAGGSVGSIYFINDEVSASLLEAAFAQFTRKTARLGGAKVEALPPVSGAGASFGLTFPNELDAAAIDLNVGSALADFKLSEAVTTLNETAASDTSTPTQQAAAKALLEKLKPLEGLALDAKFFEECDPFPLADRIDPSTAQQHRESAVRAIALSILGIIIYVAFRFRSWYFGFAAVAALIHDVLIVLGLVALVNWLGIVDARLNLVTVAAFLTLIGYSINDSIVVFDRIRENRGSSGRARISEIIDRSINQTLSRTLRTTGTTWIVVMILLIMNYGANSSLEGFAFILAMGVLVGTYSSIFIAAPTLLYLPWLWERLGGSIRGFMKACAPYMLAAAGLLFGIAFLHGDFTFTDDFSVPLFNSILLGIPVGILALFLLNFIRFVSADGAEGVQAAG